MKRSAALAATLLACAIAAPAMADDFADAMAHAAPLDGRWTATVDSVDPETGEAKQTEIAFTRARDPNDAMAYATWSENFMMQYRYQGDGRYVLFGWNTSGLYVERTELLAEFTQGPDENGNFTLVNTSWKTQRNGSSFEWRTTSRYEDGTLTQTQEVRPPGAQSFKRQYQLAYTRAGNPPPTGPIVTGRLVTPEDYDDSGWQITALTQAASLLEAEYIYEDKGLLLATYLREDQDAFAAIEDRAEFAAAVTNGLQRVVNDGHLRLVYTFGEPESAGPDIDAERPFDCRTATVEHRWLDDNIGFIQIPHFRRDMESILTNFRAAMDEFAGADALILDLRGNCGGSGEVVLEMESYFFAEPTFLAATEQRGRDLSESWSLAEVPGTRYLEGPVYILVNGRTASGGEGFTFALGHMTGRATVVGERTAGLGHFGRNHAVGRDFQMFVPSGRPFDPETGLGFETIGLAPDIEVPQADALDAALADLAARGG